MMVTHESLVVQPRADLLLPVSATITLIYGGITAVSSLHYPVTLHVSPTSQILFHSQI